jgi:hypothetical protein
MDQLWDHVNKEVQQNVSDVPTGAYYELHKEHSVSRVLDQTMESLHAVHTETKVTVPFQVSSRYSHLTFDPQQFT